MCLVSTRHILKKAKMEGYAVPAFNIHNLETIHAVINVAESRKSPVIIAATPGTIRYSGIKYLSEILKVAAANASVPIAFHLDHHENLEDIFEAIKLGCKSVMIDASDLPYEENIKKVKKVVEFAHRYDVTVEAELGRLVGIEDNIQVDSNEAYLTDPVLAADFVKKTGIDSLAIAIGTAHGLYKKKPKIDIKRLKAIRKSVDIPLVLHGASGLSEEVLTECIQNGISKVNIATELKIPFTSAIKSFLNEHPENYDLRKYMIPGKEAMMEVINRKIDICGSAKKGVLEL